MTRSKWSWYGLLACALAGFGAEPARAGDCPGAGDCCEPNRSPGCDDARCCALICAQDTFCCDVQWDLICAASAELQCDACGKGPCALSCQGGDVAEGEPCGADSNGGCNSTPPAFAVAAGGLTICGTAWAAGGARDTDWFLVTTTDEASRLSAQLVCEFVGQCFVIDGLDDCAPVVIGDPGEASACRPGTVAQATVPAGDYALFVATATFDGAPCGSVNDYRLSIQSVCTGDTDGSGEVDVDDLVNIILLWGTNGLAGGIDADVDNSGVVDVRDLIFAVTNWGPCAPE